MNKMLTLLAVAAFVVGFASGAQAATYDSLTLSSTVLPGNVNLGDVSLDVNAGIVNNDSSTHKLPIGSTTADSYLSVYGNGSATYTLNEPQTEVSFNWGTIDLYNTLRVTDKSGDTYDIKGQDILSLAGSFSLALIKGTSNVYVTIKDLTGIASLTFLSTSNSFEISDLSAVPLPAALVLFGTALAGTAAIRRRKKAKAA